MQVDSIKTRVESANGFSVLSYNMMNRFHRLLSNSTCAATSRATSNSCWTASLTAGSTCLRPGSPDKLNGVAKERGACPILDEVCMYLRGRGTDHDMVKEREAY